MLKTENEYDVLERSIKNLFVAVTQKSWENITQLTMKMATKKKIK